MRFQALFSILAIASTTLAAHIPRQASTAPSPHQPNIIPSCTAYYKVATGDNCFKLMTTFGNFTLADFYSWNPDVGNDCSNLLLNYYVCINGGKTTPTGTPTSTPSKTSTSVTPTSTCPAEPSPVQPGIVNCCKKFYQVVENDSCIGVENKFKISDADFRKWNTGIDKDCFNLFKGYYVCVGA